MATAPEHKDSAALICKRDDLPKPSMSTSSSKEPSDGTAARLCSHEYFHLWNVKRIKPAAFSPYRLDSERYTRLLWAFEGVTSYYDDLALVRAGVINVDSWLELLGRTATRVLRGAGRKRQSIADSSFDAWIKFYRPDENTPNAVVSYYTKGALVALALDLTLRQATDERSPLDDVMRARCGPLRQDRRGRTEDRGEARLRGGRRRSASFFDEYVGTADLALQPLLAPYGIEVMLRPAESDHDLAQGRQEAQGGPGARGSSASRSALAKTVRTCRTSTTAARHRRRALRPAMSCWRSIGAPRAPTWRACAASARRRARARARLPSR